MVHVLALTSAQCETARITAHAQKRGGGEGEVLLDIRREKADEERYLPNIHAWVHEYPAIMEQMKSTPRWRIDIFQMRVKEATHFFPDKV